MKIAGPLAIVAIGAILSFAVQDAISGVDLTLIGYILMGAGALALVLSLIFGRPKTSLSRSTETRTLDDPNTGEKIHRTEIQED